MDVLSEVLKVVKLQGALFYNGEFSSPYPATEAKQVTSTSRILQCQKLMLLLPFFRLEA